jgi:hypothetical protein
VPVGVTGHRTQRPRGQGPSWAPRTTPSPTQLLTGPRGRTGANNAPPGASDRAAGPGVFTANGPQRTGAFLAPSPPPLVLTPGASPCVSAAAGYWGTHARASLTHLLGASQTGPPPCYLPATSYQGHCQPMPHVPAPAATETKTNGDRATELGLPTTKSCVLPLAWRMRQRLSNELMTGPRRCQSLEPRHASRSPPPGPKCPRLKSK